MSTKILPGRPHPAGSDLGRRRDVTSPFTRSTPNGWSCVCSINRTLRKPSGFVLPERTTYVWHGYIHGLQPGQLYGYRVHGPFQPNDGLRFNSNKLLIDPYAKALAGQVDWSAPIFPYQPGTDDADLSFDESDDAAGMQKCVVVNPYFDWEEDRPLCLPLSDSIIYELHVKGFTKRHPEIPEGLRGTYAGLAAKPSDSISEAAGNYRGGTDAGARIPHRQASGRERTHELLGLQHYQFLQSRMRVIQAPAIAAARWRSSRPW